MRIDYKITVLHLVFFTGLFFLFLGGPGYHSSRSFADVWNLGHVFLFVLFVFILYKDWSWLNRQSYVRQWLIVLVLTLILAVSTEFIQQFISRQFDKWDIMRDIAGSVLGLVILEKWYYNSLKLTLLIKQGITALIIGMNIFPLATSITDEFQAYRQFPLLGGFESPLELDRWKADGAISISDEVVYAGKHSLKVTFTTQKYSPVTLFHSLGNWQGYDSLMFSVYNPDTAAMKIVCRIHDVLHKENDNAFKDRFNRSFLVQSGWNTFTVSLKDVTNAPENRQMIMRAIEELSFFSYQLKQSRILFLDQIILLKSH